MAIWRGPCGVEVEAITLDRRACLRVSRIIGRDRILIAYCDSVREVARHVDLADLAEVIQLPAARMGLAGAAPEE